MSSPGMQPQKQPHLAGKSQVKGRLGDMPSISSSVAFDSSCGVTINIGSIESSVTEVNVAWNGSEVYDSSTPNAAGQSSIPGGTAVSGSTYALSVSIWYAGWDRPSVFSGTVTARASSTASTPLPRTQNGGTNAGRAQT